ncbi:MAG: hypothetical protein PVG65_05785 [Candidatus Thorarchaeota archaeon]|jgi:hypothetical protein
MRTLIDDIEMTEKGFYPSNIKDGWDDEDPTKMQKLRKAISDNPCLCRFYKDEYLNPCCQ